jgi:hypothetical protein
MTDNIIEIDLSDRNTSKFKIEVLDTDSEMRFTRYFKNFEIPKEGLIFDRVSYEDS